MNERAKWIWDSENTKKNDWVMFVREFTAEKMEHCLFEISVDTRYFLWLNGKICVWDGGLFRDAYCAHSGFIDAFDIAAYLQEGQNTLEILVWHYGNGGRNNNPLAVGGLLYSCEALQLFSDSNTLCQRHKSFGETGEPLPSYLYGGYNIRYDANVALSPLGYRPSTCYPCEDYGKLFQREIPMFALSELVATDYYQEGALYKIKLPTALHVMPYIEVIAQGGEVIDIRNDKYTVNGGPGGGGVGQYNGHRTEYVCKAGKNCFLNYDYMACETLEFHIPSTVRVERLSYRVSEYNTEIMPVFQCENQRVNRLVEKCARTLKFCMRDNFMDCPDRERGQWIGDVSVQAPQVFFALDQRAIPLLKKAILNFITLRKGDVLVGNVPGINYSELPSQSLNAISDMGMIYHYYEQTHDLETVALCFEPMVAYLKLWEMGDDGMVVRRQGDWCWFDHLNNQDTVILENTWYYSALAFSCKVAAILGEHHHDAFIEARQSSIKENFERLFWKEKHYASGQIVDDRANAMAVLTGLAKQEHYPAIKNVLRTTFNASTYMEGYVCEALFCMGYHQFGFERMMHRYLPLIENEDSTLWEDFAILGSKNHAWSGYPLTIIYKYIAGVKIDQTEKTITIAPDFSIAATQKYEIDIGNGRLTVDLKMIDGAVQGTVLNTTGYRIEGTINC